MSLITANSSLSKPSEPHLSITANVPRFMTKKKKQLNSILRPDPVLFLVQNSLITLPIVNCQLSIVNSKSHVFHLFIIRTAKRDKLQTYLTENGIQTLIHYPIPPHKQLAYRYWNNFSFPITEKIQNEVLSLPLSPVMEDKEIQFVVEKINDFTE